MPDGTDLQVTTRLRPEDEAFVQDLEKRLDAQGLREGDYPVGVNRGVQHSYGNSTPTAYIEHLEKNLVHPSDDYQITLVGGKEKKSGGVAEHSFPTETQVVDPKELMSDEQKAALQADVDTVQSGYRAEGVQSATEMGDTKKVAKEYSKQFDFSKSASAKKSPPKVQVVDESGEVEEAKVQDIEAQVAQTE